jgi:hypothetical protein
MLFQRRSLRVLRDGRRNRHLDIWTSESPSLPNSQSRRVSSQHLGSGLHLEPELSRVVKVDWSNLKTPVPERVARYA